MSEANQKANQKQIKMSEANQKTSSNKINKSSGYNSNVVTRVSNAVFYICKLLRK